MKREVAAGLEQDLPPVGSGELAPKFPRRNYCIARKLGLTTGRIRRTTRARWRGRLGTARRRPLTSPWSSPDEGVLHKDDGGVMAA